MAKRSRSNHRDRLEEAIAILLQNQAQFVSQQAHSQERFASMDQRFARIEGELAEIKAILLRHEQMLRALPEAIRKEIGFQPRESTPAGP